MKTGWRHYQYALAAVIIILISATVKGYSGQGGVLERIKHAKTTQNDHQDKLITPVDRKTVMVKTPYQGGGFWTETRKGDIGRYSCNACHNSQIPDDKRSKENAHHDIKLDHGGDEKPLSCLTCHSKENRNLLVKADTTVDMDHTYEMCGQCHFRQLQDWIGGAHGKRVSYWAGQRVVKNCTGCHSPHSPRFEKRWPQTYSPPINQ